MNKNERNKKRKQKELLVAKATAYKAGIDGRIISRDKATGAIVLQPSTEDKTAEDTAGVDKGKAAKVVVLKKDKNGWQLPGGLAKSATSDICTKADKGGDLLFSGIYNRTIFTGDQNHETDNLEVMRHMDSASVDLIYLDPPFNSKRDYFAPFDSDAAELGAFFADTFARDDRWHGLQDIILNQNKAIYAAIKSGEQANGKSAGSYLTFMAVRLMELHRLLKPAGSIYLHCDPTMSHYLKALMDAIFGNANFRNEIIWHYANRLSRKGYPFPKMHDTLLCYTKGNKFVKRAIVDEIWTPSKTQQRRMKTGWEYYKGQLIVYDEKKARADIPDFGTQEWVAGKTGRKRVTSVWAIDILNSMAKERTGYPTQKPLALLERIVKASSNEGDIVLDPFCGCGTACDAAEQLGRKWIGIDASIAAGAVMVEKREGLEAKRRDVNWRMINAKGKGMPKRGDNGETAIEYKPPTPALKRDTKAMEAFKVFQVQQNGGVQCWVTGKKDHADNLEVDHIVGKAEAKRLGWDNARWNGWDNFQVVTGEVNSSKGGKSMDDFLLHWEANGGALSPEAAKRIRQIKRQRELA